MTFKRWLEELFHPEKICDREGCDKLETRSSKWYVKPWKAGELIGKPYFSFRSVCEKMKKTEEYCPRCKRVFDEKWTYIDSFQSFTIHGDSTEWDEEGMMPCN
jgi:hypothetical protein